MDKAALPNFKPDAVWRTASALFPIVIFALLLSGCSLTAMKPAPNQPDPVLTGATGETVETEGVDPADAETIRRTVAGAEFASGESHLLAWSNPDTGSSGTITAIENTISGDGRPCRKFSTTLDSFMGISLYDGETCELREGLWILSRLARNRAE